jgi:hypothetical protein
MSDKKPGPREQQLREMRETELKALAGKMHGCAPKPKLRVKAIGKVVNIKAKKRGRGR